MFGLAEKFSVRSQSPVFLSLHLLGVCLFAVATVVVVPTAAGAEPAHRVVKDGYTVTWTDSDFGDARVERTPRAVDTSDSTDGHFATKLITRYRQVARSYDDDRGVQPLAAPDGCTGAPDGYGLADFEPACNTHDRCYSKKSHHNRKACDKALYRHLKAECKRTYAAFPPRSAQQRNKCVATARVYYHAVRKFGSSHYNGQGKNN